MNKIRQWLDSLFSPTGNLMGLFGQIGDVILVSVLWLICSIPVVTIGAATAAMYDVMLRIVEGKEDALFVHFFEALRRRFGFLTGLWTAMLALGAFLALDLYFYYVWSSAGEWMGTVLFSLFAAATAMYLCMMVYLLPYAHRTSLRLTATIKNAFYISTRHLPVTLLTLLINAGLIFLCLNFIILLVVLPGIMCWADTLCIGRLLRKYAPIAEEGDEEA